jgi:D-alanyl-D-alanine carboxypeptidase
MLAFVALGPATAVIARATAATSSPVAAPTTWDEVLQAGLDRGLTSVALRVEQGSTLLFEGAAGLASRENQTPVAATDRFRIASITKTFTAVLVLQQVDAGLLRLDDTISKWLDDPVVAQIPNVDQITIRQLLSHTSGVYDYFDQDSPFWQDAYFGEGADWTRVWTPLELLAYVGADKHAPYFAPGKGAHYSNTGYILLGLILEKATDQHYVDLLHAGIIHPVGLTDTYFAAAEPVPGGMVDAYHLIAGDLVNVSTIDLSALWTAAAMVSTTKDLDLFLDALLGGELVQPATLDEMLTFSAMDHPGFDGGLGVARWQTTGGAAIGHSGDGPGSAGRMYRLADTDLTIVMLTNTGGDDEATDTTYTDAVQMALATAANG